MFTRQSQASKIALAALVALCRAQNIPLIDCQQETPHLALMGARPIARSEFETRMHQAQALPGALTWAFDPAWWDLLTPPSP